MRSRRKHESVFHPKMGKSEEWKANQIKFKKLMRCQFRSENPSDRRFMNSRNNDPNRMTYEEILRAKEMKKKQIREE